MLQSIKFWWKENVIAVLFFGLIIFGLISVVFTSSLAKGEATTLLVFADDAILEMDQRNETITNKTILAKNTLDDFNDILNDLYAYSDDLQDFRSDIPRKNSSSEAVKLQNQLDLFFANTKVSVDRTITDFTRQRDLREDTFAYGTLQQVATEDGTKETLQSAYEGGLAIFRDLNNQAVITVDEEAKSRIQSRADEEKLILDELEQILDTIEEGPLTEQSKTQIQALYSEGWPTSSPSFPRIDIEEIETKAYAEELTDIQSSMKVLIAKYDIENVE